MSNGKDPASPGRYENGSGGPKADGGNAEALLKAAEQALAKGQLAEAEDLASQALSAAPENAQAHHLKGVALLARREVQDAVAFLARARDRAPQEPLVQMRLGVAQAMAGNFADSLAALQEATRLAPELAEAQLNLGMTLLKLERWPEAAEAFQRTLALQPDAVQALHGLGMALIAQERFEEAVEVLGKTVSLAPQLAAAQSNLANALLGLDRTEEGLAALRRAAELKPRNRRIRLNLAVAYMNADHPAEAMAAYEHLLALAPDWAEAVAGHAGALEKQNRPAEARAQVVRALELEPGNTAAGLTLLRLHLRAGEHGEAVELAEDLLTRDLAREQREHVQFQLGRAFEGLERFDKAFEAYAASQALAARSPKMQRADRARYPQLIADTRTWFTADAVRDWPRALDDGRAAPVFFLGFPRSGTTLLERMLRAHPALTTGDEPAWLRQTLRHLPVAYPEGCGPLSEGDLRRLREIYFGYAESDLGETLAGRRLVDKHPLNTPYLGVIRRIFPESKVLFALRDPRDVVLSCFTQPFRGQNAMVHFLELDTAARLYAQTLDLWFQLRETLGLDTFAYRYEDLTRDPEGTAREILDFLGLDWDPEVLRHHEQTEGAFIRTASRAAVTEAIHGKAVARWRNYRSQLAPVLPILQPYVQALGYDDA